MNDRYQKVNPGSLPNARRYLPVRYVCEVAEGYAVRALGDAGHAVRRTLGGVTHILYINVERNISFQGSSSATSELCT